MSDYHLEGFFAKFRGVIGRYPEPGDRYLFPFDKVVRVPVHMLGVRKPLQVEWWARGELVERRIMPAWWGTHSERADLVIESAPEAA